MQYVIIHFALFSLIFTFWASQESFVLSHLSLRDVSCAVICTNTDLVASKFRKVYISKSISLSISCHSLYGLFNLFN